MLFSIVVAIENSRRRGAVGVVSVAVGCGGRVEGPVPPPGSRPPPSLCCILFVFVAIGKAGREGGGGATR